ncbi:hypothetical protein [Vibrio sp. CyArs1]|uniref:hypothetical protein n=1 Tax=Vibrio sp. CyArs1 TaxID=2682577 RepID=UPI001F052B98|nr:hypothetical protein [Vibrio sp. CyArs1]
MSDTNFAAIGQLVTEARHLLDSIKGGAIRVMEDTFEALKQTITSERAQVVSNIDTLGRKKLQSIDSELATIRQNMDIQALNGEGRYVTEITVNGDKDTFYPVAFQMPRNGETEIQIFRHWSWNNIYQGVEASDFNAERLASALIVLRGVSSEWSDDGDYLRTLVNRQRYRKTVANIGYMAYCSAVKYDASGADTPSNQNKVGFQAGEFSGFMLRGGKLKYQIITNQPIDFRLLADGDVIGHHKHETTNVSWIARTLPLSEVVNGDPANNHSDEYISYITPKALSGDQP